MSGRQDTLSVKGKKINIHNKNNIMYTIKKIYTIVFATFILINRSAVVGFTNEYRGFVSPPPFRN